VNLARAQRLHDVLEVLEPGLLTTVQDGGREGHAAEGVPRSGAADAIGLAVANLTLGNRPDAAAIECTLLGPRLRALDDVAIGIGGADLGASIEASGVPLEPGSSYQLRAGDVIAFRATAEEAAGCRAYLALPGGIDVPTVLGSRSTCLPASFGGFRGRSLQSGDRIATIRAAAPAGRTATIGQGRSGRAELRRIPADLAAGLPSPAQRIRILSGPASGPGDPAFAGLVEGAWLVDPASDRRGLRLEGADGQAASAENTGAENTGAETTRSAPSPRRPGAGSRLVPLAAGELPSHGVIPGAIQVTPAGQPLVLMPDSGTTGGYPIVAVVIHADIALLGQLGPGAEVRFRPTTLELARAAELERRALIEAIGRRMADSVSS
jgi:5-oxoprolinase (ATP-hydrolysing) subunit C